MATAFEFLIGALVITTLLLAGSSRLGTCIRVAAVQGVALGVLALALHVADRAWPTAALALLNITLKGWVFPWLLFRAIRTAGVRREVEPLLGYTASLFLAVFFLGLGYWVAARLPVPPHAHLSPHLVPVAFFTMMTGLLLIVARRKALTQVVGYLVLENGIYAFGLGLLREWTPLLVELGILLDVFVAVFVMGIAIFHINREFDHIDVDRLAALKD